MSTRPSPDEGFLSRWARRKADARAGSVPTDDGAAPQPDSVKPELASGVADATAPALATASGLAARPAVVSAQETCFEAAGPHDGAGGVATAEPAPAPQPAPTLADVAALTRESDFSPFVARGVGDDVKRAAMKKLFTDPRYNVMDGLDTYIDDYNKPDPIPPAMLRQLMAGFRKFVDPVSEAEAEAEAAMATATASSPESPPSTSALAAPVEAEPAPHAATQGQAHDHPDLQLQQDDAAGRSGAGEGTRA